MSIEGLVDNFSLIEPVAWLFPADSNSTRSSIRAQNSSNRRRNVSVAFCVHPSTDLRVIYLVKNFSLESQFRVLVSVLGKLCLRNCRMFEFRLRFR